MYKIIQCRFCTVIFGIKCGWRLKKEKSGRNGEWNLGWCGWITSIGRRPIRFFLDQVHEGKRVRGDRLNGPKRVRDYVVKVVSVWVEVDDCCGRLLQLLQQIIIIIVIISSCISMTERGNTVETVQSTNHQQHLR